MHVIIMRHGQAAYAGTDRVLTATGRAEAAATGLKLGGLFTIHHVFASPKTRALTGTESRKCAPRLTYSSGGTLDRRVLSRHRNAHLRYCCGFSD